MEVVTHSYKLMGWGYGCSPITHYVRAESPQAAFEKLRNEWPINDLAYLMVYRTDQADNEWNGWIGEIMLDTLKFRSKKEIQGQNWNDVCNCLPLENKGSCSL